VVFPPAPTNATLDDAFNRKAVDNFINR